MQTITLTEPEILRFDRLMRLRDRLRHAPRTIATLQRMRRVDGWLTDLVPPATDPLR